MKKWMLFLTILVATKVAGQNYPVGMQRDSSRGKGRERIMLMKENYLRENLGLNESQSSAFWPMYREHATKLSELTKAKRQIQKQLKDNYESMSDAEVDKLISGSLEYDRKIHLLNESYHTELRKVLPPKKVVKLKLLEREFQKTMLKKMAERRQGRMGGGNPGTND